MFLDGLRTGKLLNFSCETYKINKWFFWATKRIFHKLKKVLISEKHCRFICSEEHQLCPRWCAERVPCFGWLSFQHRHQQSASWAGRLQQSQTAAKWRGAASVLRLQVLLGKILQLFLQLCCFMPAQKIKKCIKHEPDLPKKFVIHFLATTKCFFGVWKTSSFKNLPIIKSQSAGTALLLSNPQLQYVWSAGFWSIFAKTKCEEHKPVPTFSRKHNMFPFS